MVSPLRMEYSLQPPFATTTPMLAWDYSVVLNVIHTSIEFHIKKLHTIVCNSYLKHDSHTQKQTHIFHTQFAFHYIMTTIEIQNHDTTDERIFPFTLNQVFPLPPSYTLLYPNLR
jgi:hypothetical protein